MGFTTGFIGGLALTSTVLYLSISQQRQDRLRQSILLRQQCLLLDSHTRQLTTSRSALVRSGGTLSPTDELLMARLRRAGFVETVKDRWNAEVEGAVSWLQHVDWLSVATTLETGVRDLYASIRDRARGGGGESGGA